MHFEKKYFQKVEFTKEQIKRYWQNAKRDFKIASEDSYVEVRFTYAYQALIKAGIALLAKEGSVKVRSIPGHHIQILKKFSDILDDSDVFVIGNAMRMKRNQDMYSGGQYISKKEADDYVNFVKTVIKKTAASMGH